MINQRFEEPINVNIEVVESPAANEYIESLRLYKKYLIIHHGLSSSKSKTAFSLQKSLRALQEMLEDTNSPEKLDKAKQDDINSKIGFILQQTYDFLPRGTDTTLLFSSLSPFGKIVGKTIQQIVSTITNTK
jgi:hypothetical protein